MQLANGFAMQFPKGKGPINSKGMPVRIKPVRTRGGERLLKGQRKRMGWK